MILKFPICGFPNCKSWLQKTGSVAWGRGFGGWEDITAGSQLPILVFFLSKRLKLGNNVDFHAFCILGNFKSAQCKTDGWSWRFRGLNRVKAFLGSAGEFWQMRVLISCAGSDASLLNINCADTVARRLQSFQIWLNIEIISVGWKGGVLAKLAMIGNARLDGACYELARH